jgi:hypothetical protein
MEAREASRTAVAPRSLSNAAKAIVTVLADLEKRSLTSILLDDIFDTGAAAL